MFVDVPLRKQEKAVLDNLAMRCPNEGCDENIRYRDMVQHLKRKCKVATFTEVVMSNYAPKIQAKPKKQTQKVELDGVLEAMFAEPIEEEVAN